eukprot:GHVT01040570.1.p1 GENE.GHVT01040570.1~~GHVT01040570.1.p1  ORF type:complete len:122 (+),score=22.17 GHVT01040570.1:439-804(+)
MRGLPQAEVLRAAREAIEAGWLPPSILAHSGPHGQAAAPPPPAADQVAFDPLEVASLGASASLLTNCCTPVPALQRLLRSAGRLAASSAYIHQLEANGVERCQLLQALGEVRQVVASYERS